jgi:NTE family protein
MATDTPKCLLFSSGSVLTIGYLGALRVLDLSGRLSAVTTYMGVSGGALIAMGLSIGYTIDELTDIVLRMDFAAIQDIGDDAPLMLIDKYGFDTGDRVTRFFTALLRVKGFGPDTTFADISAAGRPGLVVWATEMETCMLRRFSAETTPGYTVIGAVQASMCIPLLFVPRVAEDTGHLLVDGGVLNHYPMAYLTAAERDATLGFYSRSNIQYGAPGDIADYLKQFISIILRSKNDDTPDIFRDRTIILESAPCSPISFALTNEEKAALIEEGRRAAAVWLAARGGTSE